MKERRSSQQRRSVSKCVLRNFAKFTGKHVCQSLFFNKNAGLRPATLLKKRLWHRYFPVNFAKFLRTSFSQNTSGRLLLPLGDHLFSMYEKFSEKLMCAYQRLRNSFSEKFAYVLNGLSPAKNNIFVVTIEKAICFSFKVLCNHFIMSHLRAITYKFGRFK